MLIPDRLISPVTLSFVNIAAPLSSSGQKMILLSILGVVWVCLQAPLAHILTDSHTILVLFLGVTDFTV